MTVRKGFPLFKAFTSTGALAAGYKLYTYAAGTTTPKATYQDADKAAAHSNPVVLNALGEAEIFLDGSYKFTLTDTDDNIQTGWPVDDVTSLVDAADEIGFTPYGSVTSTKVQDAMEEMIDDISSNSDIQWEVIAADDDVLSGSGYLVDTLTGAAAITLTLPASPAEGNKVYFADAGGSFGLYNLIINRNGSNIVEAAENLTVNVSRAAFGLVYTNSTYGWVLV